jgi:hypothetical protein
MNTSPDSTTSLVPLDNSGADDLRLFDDGNDLEYHVRDRDPGTSWDAATITRTAAEDVKARVLGIIRRHGPIHDEGIFAVYTAEGGMRTPQRVRTARAQLAHPGAGIRPLIKPQGTGRTPTGHATQLWVTL